MMKKFSPRFTPNLGLKSLFLVFLFILAHPFGNSTLNAKDGTIFGKVRSRALQVELADVLVVAKSATNGREIFTSTSSKGDYSFYNISPDTWRMGYRLTGYKTITPGSTDSPVVYIGSGHTAYVNVYLDQNQSRVYGYVVDATNGFFVSGASLNINGTSYLASSDSNGFFDFGFVPAGSYTLNISKPGFTSLINLAITVLGTGDTNLGNLPLGTLNVTLTGRLVAQNPSFLEGVNGFSLMSLQVLNSPQAIVTLAKDRTGVFSISGLPGQNSYRLLPSLPGYFLSTGGTEVVVVAGPFQTHVGDIFLNPYTNMIQGEVRTSDGALATNGTVTIVELGMTTPINFKGTYQFPVVQVEHDLSFSFFTLRDPQGNPIPEILNGIKFRPQRSPIPFQLPVVITQVNPLILARDIENLEEDLQSAPPGIDGGKRYTALSEQLYQTRKALYVELFQHPEGLEKIRNHYKIFSRDNLEKIQRWERFLGRVQKGK